MKKILLSLVLWLVVMVGFPHQHKDSTQWIAYYDLGYGNDRQQVMDLYLPSKRNTKTPMIVIIHGGGWNEGDKSEFNSYVAEFQKRLPGYAIANLNYRLVKKTGNFFPTQENDIQAAITFLINKASVYKVSTDFILFGMSAGAQLALLQGYKHSDLMQPKGIVCFFGPSDLRVLYNNADSAMLKVLRSTMSGTLEQNPKIFDESSPLNFATAHAAPTLLLHGDNDKIIPVTQAYMLRDKLTAAGVANKLVVYAGQAHGWEGNDLVDSYQQIEIFIKGLK